MAQLNALDELIEHHWQVVAALEKARDLMRGGAGVPSAEKPKALPAPHKATPHKAAPHKAAARKHGPEGEAPSFVQEIDGVAFACSEQQHAFIELLGEHDVVSRAMYLPIWDNKLAAFYVALKDLRLRMASAGVNAEINTYRSLGYRLEALPAPHKHDTDSAEAS